MKRRDTLTALGFLAALALALAVVVSSCFGGEGALETLLKQALRDRDVQTVLDGAERAVNQDLDRDHFFIQLFGGVQRLCGRRVVEDAVGENTVVKLSTGALNFVDLTGPDPAPQAAENAGATAALAQDLSERGIPYRFLLAPQKIGRDQALLPTGVTDRGNAAADAFLAGLAEAGAAYTDLRPLFEENGSYADWFFRTDHHWKPEAAFFAWQYLTGLLEEEYGFACDAALTQASNWDTRVLEDFFLGSQGKRVGTLYAGTDRLTLYTPKFETQLTLPNIGLLSRTGGPAGLVRRQPLHLLRRGRLPPGHRHQPPKPGRPPDRAPPGLVRLRADTLFGAVLLGTGHHRPALFFRRSAGHRREAGARPGAEPDDGGFDGKRSAVSIQSRIGGMTLGRR